MRETKSVPSGKTPSGGKSQAGLRCPSKYRKKRLPGEENANQRNGKFVRPEVAGLYPRPALQNTGLPVTESKLQEFLAALRVNGGIVSLACEMVQVSRPGVYNRRRADPEFKAAWDKAQDDGIDVLEDAAKCRALWGTQEPVHWQGQVVDHVTKYSDTILLNVLKAHRKKYRDRTELTGPDGQPLNPAIQQVLVYLPDNGRNNGDIAAEPKALPPEMEVAEADGEG